MHDGTDGGKLCPLICRAGSINAKPASQRLGHLAVSPDLLNNRLCVIAPQCHGVQATIHTGMRHVRPDLIQQDGGAEVDTVKIQCAEKGKKMSHSGIRVL